MGAGTSPTVGHPAALKPAAWLYACYVVISTILLTANISDNARVLLFIQSTTPVYIWLFNELHGKISCSLFTRISTAYGLLWFFLPETALSFVVLVTVAVLLAVRFLPDAAGIRAKIAVAFTVVDLE